MSLWPAVFLKWAKQARRIRTKGALQTQAKPVPDLSLSNCEKKHWNDPFSDSEIPTVKIHSLLPDPGNLLSSRAGGGCVSEEKVSL